MSLPIPLLGHGVIPIDEFARGLAAFGTDWLYLAVLGVVLAAITMWMARSAPTATVPRGRRVADGAGAVTGLPGWVAGPVVVVLRNGLLFALVGFFWDVAWHIGIGRDEFLLSPPHVALVVGLSLLGVAGAVGIRTATREQAEVGWHVGRRRVPAGAAALLGAGVAAVVGFGVDELWHEAYGLDITMWSPTHITMISAAVFSPLAGWLLLAEAGPRVRHAGWHRAITVVLAAAALAALSAWQLEFDLGVPRWQHGLQPVLIAVAAGFGLPLARVALGRGGALVAVAGFLLIRVLMWGLTTHAWGLPEPRFPLYVAAAVGVEIAFLLARRRSPLVQAAAAGLAVATLGLAGAWAWTRIWAYHPWTSALLDDVAVAGVVAVAAALLGTAFGRVVSHRHAGLRARHLVPAAVLILATVVALLPRHVPDAGQVTVTTTPVADGWVDVTVTAQRPLTGADRFEVMAWQGGGHVLADLVPADVDGTWVSERPVPVGGDWKTIVRFVAGDELGGVPVWMPADPEIGAAEVPLVPQRTQAFVADAELMLREAHDGPAWPGRVAYTVTAISLLTIVGLIAAGAVHLERRRRAAAALEDARRALHDPEPSHVP